MFSCINTRITILAILFALISGEGVLNAKSISGLVKGDDGKAIVGATVSIPAIRRAAATDAHGKFEISELGSATYTIEIKSIGYKTETRMVRLLEDNVTIDVTLAQSLLYYPGITVTGTANPTEALNTPQSVTAVEGRELNMHRGETVIRSIENVPGVNLYTTGSGIAKPVIRGLTSQRVLVVVDGMRQEGQQWGDEHAPELDALDVDRIEVVRGPSSVLYGSDALGGVVNVMGAEIPSVEHGHQRLSGLLRLNGFSNNSQGAGALSLWGANDRIGYRGNLSLRVAGDARTPDGKLKNSGMKEANGSGMIGIKDNWGSIAAEYRHFGTQLKIHEDPTEDPNATPFQKVQHDNAHLHGKFIFPKVLLAINAGVQKNHRREYEEKDATDAAIDLNLRTATLDVRARQISNGPLTGNLGFSVESQRNESKAEEKLIPDFDMTGFAGFAFEEFALDKLTLSGGVRYDNQKLKIKESEDLGVSSETRKFDAVTATFGAVVRPVNYLAVAANIGRGWRSPSAFELFVNGVHEGTIRYEIGDSHLKPEKSLNFDFSLRAVSPRFVGEASVFRNKISAYIYQQSTGEVDPESGLDKYLNKQADATLIGGEISVQVEALEWLILHANANVVRGTNDALDEPLPLIPANSFLAGARLTNRHGKNLLNPYVSVDVKLVNAQKRIPTYESTTAGYGLLNLGAGTEFKIGSHTGEFDLRLENVFDQAYREHLSRYKAYGLNPGRNITAKVSLPFEVVQR